MIHSDTLPTIKASRVTLRWLTDEDIESLFAVFSNPEVTRYWSTPPMRDRAEASELLRHIHLCFERKDLYQWGVARQADDRVIGTCTLSSVDATHRRAELGFALGRQYWGQGLMSEALHALLAFAFKDLNLHRLEADVDPRNSASIKTLERLGFQREGYLRERWHVNGEIQDAVFYGLLRREWRSSETGSQDQRL